MTFAGHILGLVSSVRSENVCVVVWSDAKDKGDGSGGDTCMFV